MPEFKVAKAKKLESVLNAPINEDKFYIVKENDLFGKIFYDFDSNTRLEVKTSNINYKLNLNVNDNKIIVQLNNLINLKTNIMMTDINYLSVGELVIALNALFYISKIDSTSSIELTKIYEQDYISWNNYYN